MALSHTDFLHPIWRALAADLRARLETLREQNDQLMAAPERDKLIGRIAEVKRLLDLEKQATLYPHEFPQPAALGSPRHGQS